MKKKVTIQFEVKVPQDFDMKEKAERDAIIKDELPLNKYKRARVVTVENLK